MSIKLTNAQLVMLTAAAQREDRCIAAPPGLKGAPARKIAAKLVASRLAEEIKAKPGDHVWRRDDADGQAYALRVTAAGLKAVGVEEAEAVEAPAEIPTRPGDTPNEMTGHEPTAADIVSPEAIAAPREGSKLAAVVGLLRREGGATIEELAATMGWLPHTTRATLTGLRKRGFGIDRRKAKKDQRASAYVIVDGSNAAEG